MKSHNSNQKKNRDGAEQIVEKFELPKDLFLGMPILSMEGNRTLCIANHRGIVKYSRQSIIVAGRSYGIEITGRELAIPRFTKEMIEITGYMKSVTFLL